MHSVAQMPWCDEVAQNPVVEQAAASAIGTLVIRTPGRKLGLHGGQTNIETASAPARPGSRSASCAAPPKSWEDLGPARASPAAPRRARRRPRSRQGRPGSEAVRPQQSSVSSFRQRATAGRDRRSRSSRRSDEASAGPPGFRIPTGRRKVSIKSGNSNPPAAARCPCAGGPPGSRLLLPRRATPSRAVSPRPAAIRKPPPNSPPPVSSASGNPGRRPICSKPAAVCPRPVGAQQRRRRSRRQPELPAGAARTRTPLPTGSVPGA